MSTFPIFIFFILVIIFFTVIVSFVLRGLAYKIILNEYMGFIPLLGSIFCKYKLADKYNNPYRDKYLIFSLARFILFPIIYLVFMIISAKFIYYFAFNKLNSSFFIALITIFILLGIMIAYIITISYFSYKILYTLVDNISNYDNIGIKAFVFTIFPIIFYLWILTTADKFINSEF